MSYIDADACTTYIGEDGHEAPVIYVIDQPDYSFGIEEVVAKRRATIVTVPVANWDDSLTPWPAKGLYRGDADFKGDAATTLAELTSEVIPAVEDDERLSPTWRAICGYSLGGLFSLYAFTHENVFAACGCLSGSVWYEGWLEHLRSLPYDGTGRFAYLSIGSREKRAPQPILHCVQDNMEACAEILSADGCKTQYEVGPGTHTDHVQERFDAGLSALDEFLKR